ncbi:MAG: hypothetical protein HRS57_02545, partial [Mycoplasmataceae bacterium]|nr:hypothetical protein [Mycoplasmataceae bacterium]
QVGVSNIIDGGQGNNPSVSDLLKEIENTNSENVFILPNNSNIILTAEHAASEYKGDKNIKVIPTKSSGQGVVLSYIFDKDEEDAESVYGELIELLNLTTIAQISPAIKDAKIDGVSIKKDEFMTIFDKKIIQSNSDINLSTRNLVKKMIKDEYEIITMFYGKNMNRKDIKKTVDFVDSLDTEVEIVIKDGGQKVYNWEVVGEK